MEFRDSDCCVCGCWSNDDNDTLVGFIFTGLLLDSGRVAVVVVVFLELLLVVWISRLCIADDGVGSTESTEVGGNAIMDTAAASTGAVRVPVFIWTLLPVLLLLLLPVVGRRSSSSVVVPLAAVVALVSRFQKSIFDITFLFLTG